MAVGCATSPTSVRTAPGGCLHADVQRGECRATSASSSTATGAGPRRSASRSPPGTSAGADKIHELLDWCDEAGVEVVTLWLLSTDNLPGPPAELAAAADHRGRRCSRLAATGRWRVHPVGALDLLPAETARHAEGDRGRTAGNPGVLVNVAVGYGGRREIADAVRSLLADARRARHHDRGLVAESSTSSTSPSTSTRGASPTPTWSSAPPGSSGCRGFLLWQSAHSRVLLLRGLLAGLPPGRLPARAARLRHRTAATAPELRASQLPEPALAAP